MCSQEHQGNAAEAAGAQRRCEFIPTCTRIQYHKTYSLHHYGLNIVQPRLSGPRLSGTSIIRTSQRPKIQYYACAEGMSDDLLWVWL